MKRLRKKYPENKIRFFHCGEYGENLGRPHYHACIFNFDFPDKILWKKQNDQPYFTSEILKNLWGKGHCIIGNVTFESAAYVARYIMKKVNGEKKDEHYSTIDMHTGEVCEKRSEYTTMSRRPGIASDWYKKFKNDVFPSDEVIVNGHSVRPPKYYDGLYELDNPAGYNHLKSKRLEQAVAQASENTPERLAIKEKIKKTKLKQLKRTLHEN